MKLLDLENIFADQQADIDIMQDELDLLCEKREAKHMEIEEEGDSDNSQDADETFATIPSNDHKVDKWLQTQGLETPRAHYVPIAASTPIPTVPETSRPKRSTANEEPSMGKLADMFTQVLRIQQQDIVKVTTGDKRLREFDGDPNYWNLFKSEYERTTHEFHLSDSQNLSRLQKALKGEAWDYVEHLLPQVENVRLIMTSLEKRFGQPWFILETLMKKVKECPAPSNEKPDTIIKFDIRVKSLVANIRQSNNLMYLNSVELLHSLVAKLPADLCNDWLRWETARKKIANLADFSEWLEEQADVSIRRLQYAPPQPASKKREAEEKRPRHRRGPGAVNAAAGDDAENRVDYKHIKCSMCESKNHYLSECRKFAELNVNERWNVVTDRRPKACIGCLKPGHRARECRGSKVCGIDGCIFRHHELLHRANNRGPAPQSNAQQQAGGSNQQSGRVNVINGEAIVKGCDGPLPIVPVQLRGPTGSVKTYALLDTGASGSFIKQDVAESVGLIGENRPYEFTTADGKKVVEPNARVVDGEVAGQYRRAKFYPLRNAVTVSQMRMPPYSMDADRVRQQWPHLKRMKATTLVQVVPEVIIGNKNPILVLPCEMIHGPPDTPVAWRTPLGWTVSGELDNPMKTQQGSVNFFGSNPITNEYLHALMKESFSVENFGVVPPQRKGKNVMEDKAYRILEDTTKKVGDRWETGLLWNASDVTLPPSYQMALGRLQGTEKKMKDPEFAKQYQEKIYEYLDKGFIKKLDGTVATFDNQNPNRTWYIPHFGVTNPNKPGKFRLVFDAAAKSNGICLNDVLMKGPDLIRPLTSVLWNFRRHRIALTGDISDMFHRVLMRAEDHASQRFLWRDGEIERDPDTYEMQVLIFGATSSPCSAIYVKNKNAEQYREKFPVAVNAIINDHYVDDCLTGAENEEDVIKLRKEISDISEAGGFKVCKWMSTSSKVIKSIPIELRADGVRELGQDPTAFPVERVLGMWLDHAEDCFTFCLNLHKVPKEILEGERPTKRQVCSLVMSLYDPIGFINHFKVKGVMILQRLWRAGVDWDDEIPSDIYSDWKKWLEILPGIVNVKVPRWIGDTHSAKEVALHVFVDASEEAYAAVCYLVLNTEAGKEVSFLDAKARVAPLKKLTIPRMELMAALLGTRLVATIEKEFQVKITRRVFWSDSRTVLSWIKSEAQTFKEFVANRVGEIQELTDSVEWHWVPTKLNVADIATRYDTEISFAPEDVWFTGPKFLRESEDEWPKEKKAAEGIIAATMFEQGMTPDPQSPSPVDLDAQKTTTPNIERFSSYSRLLRATAAVQRAAKFWIAKCRKQVAEPVWRKNDQGKIDRAFSKIEPEDLQKAEVKLVLLAQEQLYCGHPKLVVNTKLSRAKKLEKVQRKKQLMICNKIIRLLPFQHDGILRVNGRLMNANIPGEAKTPIILPSWNRLTELIIMKEHEDCAHQGRETVLNNLRKKFWIVDGRQTVLHVTRQCGRCRLRRAHPVIPQMANLPEYRLAAYQDAFSFTGLDYLGPFEVTVGRHHEKRWVALFTCLVTRGVHLEVAHGLTTDEAIMAISRFADSRKRPLVIYCDNGTNFVGAARKLKKAELELDFDVICAHGNFQGISWRFNPPAAPHCGGAWERLVRSVKKCLNSTLHAKFPHDTTFLTAIKGVEGILNSRPITHVSNDPTDPEALTPNHFLRGACDAGPPIPATPDEFDNFDCLRARWKRAQLLTHQFWEQWTRDFLPKMMLRDKWKHPTEPIKLGDLVFIVDPNQPRNIWIRGYISKVFVNKQDGQVRMVLVTAKTKEKDLKQRRTVTYKRHVSSICPLGLNVEIQEDALPKSEAGTVGEDSCIIDDDYEDLGPE